MLLTSKISAAILLFIIIIAPTYSYCAQNQYPESSATVAGVTANPRNKPLLMQGVINSDNINIRSDSRVNSKIICKVNKGQIVEVAQELYDWYRIRLPQTAPSFIKKNLVILISDGTAKVLRNNVNIRLGPSESSWILGKVDKNEVVNVLSDRGDWYRIEPVNNSFGWINKRFVDKYTCLNKTADKKIPVESKEENKIINAHKTDENIFEGIIKPYGMVFKRKATHKLITEDNKVFFLKGNKVSLDSLNYRRVKVIGKLIGSKTQRHPIIEIVKIEVLD